MRALHRWRRPAVTVAATLTALTLGTGIASAGQNGWDRPTPGSDGAGDSYYPQDGNGGYEVSDYDLKVNYAPDTHQLAGLQTVHARATQSLSSFDLDLRGLTVDSVRVNGAPAKFTRTGDHELVITPKTPLWKGLPFTTEVAYHGVPVAIEDPNLGKNGWQFTKSGGAFAAGEPRSATTWYPVNDTPRNKARFRLSITVPSEWGVISNGREVGSYRTRAGTTHVWAEDTPTASYMTTVAIDKWTFNKRKREDGTPIVSAYAPGTSDATKQADAQLPEVIDFLESKFGKYPVDAAGGIYLTEPIGFSLETMSRPIYSGRAGNIGTIVHENAHQWWGDTVAVDHWKDVCLNECFASYATWLWAQKNGQDLDARYLDAVASAGDSFWAGKLYDMGPGHEFTYVYSKGPVMLHALSKYLGQDAFDQVLKTWNTVHHNGNASMQEFQKYCEKVSGMDLQGFFDAWIYGNGKPSDEFLYPGDLKPAAK
ncbi:M1 family metallopeptidase [Amycolatopsis halotolerans]|uniref:Aminopeptidase N n=1 Tax=Amycolatopsis halotolerans TaxID=330083 RepID=A0ABV7QJ49_9PSEU